MIEGLKRLAPRWSTDSKLWVAVWSLALVFFLGVLDYHTGREVAITPFYLFPICWASWVAGRRAGLLLAVASAGSWLVADMMEHYEYASHAIPYWNVLMLLALFAVVVFLLTAFHDAHLHLEDVVAQRTASLREEIAERKRLEAAKIQAERLAVVGTMAAEVAHEIRNPLSSIALNLDLVHNEIQALSDTSRHSPGEGRVLVDEMRAEVKRIQHVLEDYLQFARLPKPRLEPIMLNEVLVQKLAFMNGAFDEARVELRTSFDPSLGVIHADAGQIWQSTLNLIRNGLEAMPEGGQLTVSTWREGSEARIRVVDTGGGMTPEQQRQLFEPFFSTKSRGTGLGLTLVQQIMLEHGGRVGCESTPGKGTTFTLFLPLERDS